MVKSITELRKERERLLAKRGTLEERKKLEREIDLLRNPRKAKILSGLKTSGRVFGKGIVVGGKGFLNVAEATARANPDLSGSPEVRRKTLTPSKRRSVKRRRRT